MNQTLPAAKSRFKMVSYEEASPGVREIYDDTKKTLQLPFVLNWFKCQGSNELLLKGNWSKLKNTLMEGKVPNVLKELIIYKVSNLGTRSSLHAASSINSNNCIIPWIRDRGSLILCALRAKICSSFLFF